MARFNMRKSDGVGHGHPFREVPPQGVIGWYEDLLARAEQEAPSLIPAAKAGLKAIKEFADWMHRRVP